VKARRDSCCRVGGLIFGLDSHVISLTAFLIMTHVPQLHSQTWIRNYWMSLQLLMRKMSVSRDLRASRGALLTAGNPGENGSGRPAPDSAMLDLVWLSSCVTVRGPKR
jgi:hypothetical protein